MSDARGPTRGKVAAIAFAGMLACVPMEELSSYSRGSAGGGDAPLGPSGSGGSPALGQPGPPDGGGSGGEARPALDSGTPADGDAASFPPRPPPSDAGGSADPSDRDAGADAARVEPAPPCPGGVLWASRKTCYYVASAPRSWSDARQLCQQEGRALVKIDSAEEDGFVASLSAASLWIGASDIAVDDQFVWSDGSAIVFSNWGGAQPDAFPGPDCVEKRQEPGEPWYDQPCGNPRLYVCEEPLE